jgi:MEMO1 family protein
MKMVIMVLLLPFVAAGCHDGSSGRRGPVRAPFDHTGYAHERAGFEQMLAKAVALEGAVSAVDRGGVEAPFTAVVAPHDDYVYSARVMLHAFSRVRAPVVVLFGVAHHAKDHEEVEGKLVFDAFGAWHGPYGDVPVSPLREELMAALGKDGALASDALHAGEHSLEGLVPFLQNEVRGVEIVPVLVPYMSLARLEELAARTGKALAESMRRRSWKLGEDVAVVISSDGVHYGDEGWNGKRFDDFGTSGAGYDEAVARDRALIRDHLEGAVGRDRIARLYGALVKEDFHEYRVSWCGRFSVPFGLDALLAASEALGAPAPRGELLRYGTTLDPGAADFGVPGLGPTAPANLHHWVGFFSMGFE